MPLAAQVHIKQVTVHYLQVRAVCCWRGSDIFHEGLFTDNGFFR